MSFRLNCNGWSHDADLQIIHADVKLEIDGETVIDEPLCVDVGMPAMLLSLYRDVDPDRWSEPDIWESKPFFCCGCGDPECRAFSFRVRHVGDRIMLTELEERQGDEPRILAEYAIDRREYEEQVRQAGQQFVEFANRLDYRPLYPDTLAQAKSLLAGKPSG